jgi:hypothetical protein
VVNRIPGVRGFIARKARGMDKARPARKGSKVKGGWGLNGVIVVT